MHMALHATVNKQNMIFKLPRPVYMFAYAKRQYLKVNIGQHLLNTSPQNTMQYL